MGRCLPYDGPVKRFDPTVGNSKGRVDTTGHHQRPRIGGKSRRASSGERWIYQPRMYNELPCFGAAFLNRRTSSGKQIGNTKASCAY